MVGANLCGGKEQTRRKADGFQGVATLASAPIRPIRRTFELTSPCCVKALDRGTYPARRTFSCIARHFERHFDPVCEFTS